MDEQLFRLLYDAHQGALTHVAAVFTLVGEGWMVLALLPLLLVKPFRARTLALVSVLGVTAGVVFLLKLAVHRVRPCNGLAGVSCLWGQGPTDFSFPSGHAAGSFALVAFVSTLVWVSDELRPRRGVRLAVCASLFAAATCIALSRVYLGVHFPVDVAAGACLGAAIGFGGARAHLARVSSPRESRHGVRLRQQLRRPS